MILCQDLCSMQQALEALDGSSVGFVPTMGALHAGHLSLVKMARDSCKTVVVSIFVNPTQFNDKGDLERYPRTLAADVAMLESAGADIVFAPSVEDIYPTRDTRIFDFAALQSVMEGSTRPGHFNGVAQVVSRLFDIVRPAKAFFGQKDFQQIAIIEAMVRMLNYNLQIVHCPIVREADGLAMSSRNTLLTPEHRAAAPTIYAALVQAAQSRDMTIEQLRGYVTERINATGLLNVIYFEIVDTVTLQSVTERGHEPLRGCIAVQAGEVRLIDNIEF